MRNRKLIVGSALFLLAATACRPDTIDLSYDYANGDTFEYRVVARAEAEWDIGEEGSGSYQWAADVSEVVEETTGDSALVTVTLSPTDIEEEGLPSPGASPKTFSLRVDDKGQVLEIVEVDGIAASEMEPDQVALIGTYRPPLPYDDVRLQDEWTAPAPITGDTGFQQLVQLVELRRLNRDSEGRTASLVYSGESPLTRTTALPQGEAELSGSATLSGEALFDLDGGFLREATSTTEGSFEVTTVPEDGSVPLTGTLHQTLELRLTRA